LVHLGIIQDWIPPIATVALRNSRSRKLKPLFGDRWSFGVLSFSDTFGDQAATWH
jgi:hypothetical protein